MSSVLKNLVVATLLAVFAFACSKGSGGSSGSGGPSATPAPGGAELPSPPASAGQLVVTVADDIDPESVEGYVVGNMEQLTVEKSGGGDIYINNVPPGKHDIILMASKIEISSGLMRLLGAKTLDHGIRLSDVEFLAGVRTKKSNLVLPKLSSMSGVAHLQNAADHAGIQVYVPGTDLIAMTDTDGQFSMGNVPVGVHNLYFERSGYSRGQVEKIVVEENINTDVGTIFLPLDTGSEGTMLLNSGDSVAPSKDVSVTLVVGGDAVVMKISESADFSGAAWKPLKTTFIYTFASDGQKTLYAKIANANGLESSTFDGEITVATKDPAPQLSVNALSCSDTVQVLNIGIPAGADTPIEMQVTTSGSLEGVAWEPYAATKNLPRTGTVQTILVNLKDRFGRESQASVNSRVCAAPVPALSLSPVNCRDTSITLNIGRTNPSEADAPTEMKVSLTGSLIGVSWQSYASTKSVTRSSLSGPIVVRIKDAFGRENETHLDSYQCALTLSQARSDLVGTSVGTKVIFAGGYSASGASNVVDVFDTATSIATTTTLSEARNALVATSLGSKAIFAGGYTASHSFSAVVDIFDGSTWTTASLSQGRGYLTATTLGSKAIIAGGSNNSGKSDVVDIFDGTAWTTANLSQARGMLSATMIGTNAIFAGGESDSGGSTVVDIFDGATWTTAPLSRARYALAAASAGSKAIVAGGVGGPVASDVVDIFDGTTWTTASLSRSRYDLVAASAGTKAVFAGGYTGSSASTVVDIFDGNSWTTAALSQPRQNLAAAVNGAKVFFAGGHSNFNNSDVVDIFDSVANTWSTSVTIDLTNLP